MSEPTFKLIPLLSSYSVKLGENVLRTQAAEGMPRQRLDTLNAPHRASASLTLKAKAHEYFLAFYALHKAHDFKAKVVGDGYGVEYYTCQFADTPTIKHLGKNIWQSSFTLTIKPKKQDKTALAKIVTDFVSNDCSNSYDGMEAGGGNTGGNTGGGNAGGGTVYQADTLSVTGDVAAGVFDGSTSIIMFLAKITSGTQMAYLHLAPTNTTNATVVASYTKPALFFGALGNSVEAVNIINGHYGYEQTVQSSATTSVITQFDLYGIAENTKPRLQTFLQQTNPSATLSYTNQEKDIAFSNLTTAELQQVKDANTATDTTSGINNTYKYVSLLDVCGIADNTTLHSCMKYTAT